MSRPSRTAYHCVVHIDFPQTPVQKVHSFELPDLQARDAINVIVQNPVTRLWLFEPWMKPIMEVMVNGLPNLRVEWGVYANFPFESRRLASGFWLSALEPQIKTMLGMLYARVINWTWGRPTDPAEPYTTNN